MLICQQAKFLIYGIRPCPWDDETELKVLDLLLNPSRRTYDWIRRSRLPLPCLDTLQRWPSAVELRPGDSASRWFSYEIC